MNTTPMLQTYKCARCGKEVKRYKAAVCKTIYCSRACFKRPVADRFWAKVDKSGGPDSCWPWMGAKRGGYGSFPCEINGEKHSIASRVAWILTYGFINPGDNIRHLCPGKHNPSCCNPTHMTTGTQQQNVMDSVSQGTHKYPFGVHCKKSNITEDEVRYIKRRLLDGARIKDLVAETGRTKFTIFDIKKGRSWKWLDAAPPLNPQQVESM